MSWYLVKEKENFSLLTLLILEILTNISKEPTASILKTEVPPNVD
jgi:hypothetical protein